jgi:lipoyl(octanoyl) transferase
VTSLIRFSGLVPYGPMNEAMHDLARRRLAGEVPDSLLLLEHPPVFTAGRRSRPEHLVWTEDLIRRAGAELHRIDRGGSLTFHGPGQLVGYPILDLGPRPDAVAHLRRIEEVVIRAAAEIDVALEREPGIQTGVWAGGKKVCAIGVRLMRARVSLHGFALNCTTDLSWYDAIVPCGIGDHGVTSLSELAGRRVSVEEMAPRVVRHFGDVFGVDPAPTDPAEVGLPPFGLAA